MMPRGSQLLLPANPLFIAFTLAAAVLLQMAPVGRHPAAPDLVALVLVVWNVHQSRWVGIGIGFLLGLLMDVHEGAVLGQHALGYTVLAFMAISIHRRLLWFSPLAQALQVLPVFFIAHAVMVVARIAVGGMFPGWWVLAPPLLEATLWPLAAWLLLAPQRRPPDRDQNRPL